MDPYLGEIRVTGFGYAPTGWAQCNGQIMFIAQAVGLYSILGTNFGGDGERTFALPNLQGSFAMGNGGGPGLTPRRVGETGGKAEVTLQLSELPSHGHAVQASDNTGSTPVPEGHVLARYPGPYQTDTANLTSMSPLALGGAGASLPHENLQPYLALQFIISLHGIFPERPQASEAVGD